MLREKEATSIEARSEVANEQAIQRPYEFSIFHSQLMWYQDSFLLDPTDRRSMDSRGDRHMLTIRNIQSSDFGNYRFDFHVSFQSVDRVGGKKWNSSKVIAFEI